MKKLLFTIALVITLSVASNAQNDGFFNWNNNYDADERLTGIEFNLPDAHGDINDHNAVPVGSGLLILTALGAGYSLARRDKRGE
jgi:hypothetical protein